MSLPEATSIPNTEAGLPGPETIEVKSEEIAVRSCHSCLSNAVHLKVLTSLHMQELTDNKNQLVDRVQTLRKVLPSPN